MDKTQSEVTDRIRSSIKKKLVELKLFVDDELPDYIMILIANKRSKHHMEKDLSLFLGNHTTEFTNWLWDLVNNLKINTKVKSSNGKSTVEINQTDNDSVAKEKKMDEDDVLNYDPEEEGESLCLEDSNEPIINKCVLQTTTAADTKISPPENVISQKLTEPTPCASITSTNTTKDIKKITQIKDEQKSINATVTDNNALSINIEPKIVESNSKQCVATTSAASKESSNVKSNFQSRQFDVSSSISSIVSVKQRKYGGPAALQANKLLLKAVSDAAKSVLNGRDINEYYKPTPINNLPVCKLETIPDTDKALSEQLKAETDFVDDISFVESYFKNESIEQTKRSNPQVHRTVNYSQNSDNLDLGLEDSNQSYGSCGIRAELDDSDEFYENYQRTELDDSNESYESSRRRAPPTEEMAAIKNPHFIVTLDGVDFSSLKRKHSLEEPMEIDEEEFSEDKNEQESTKKQKLSEKCKYWPACKNSDNCSFHHPTVPCKSFPDCKFGDKCLFIHPNCKFDSLCSKKDCPYTHCSKRNFKFLPKPSSKPVQVHGLKLVCKYYPKCTAKSCRFLHPKLCRFGTKCRAPVCKYSHFSVPQRNQLKWTANE